MAVRVVKRGQSGVVTFTGTSTVQGGGSTAGGWQEVGGTSAVQGGGAIEFDPSTGEGHTVKPPPGPVVKPPKHQPFPRTNHPFRGEGTRVMLSRKPGYTKRGWLGAPFRLQIPPTEDVQRTAAFAWTTFDVLGDADGPEEHSRPGGRRLRTVSITSLFLDWRPAWEVWSPNRLNPVLAMRELEQLALQGVRFQLLIYDPHSWRQADIDMLAVITQADLKAVNGEPDARYFTVAFQEYLPTAIERRSVKNEVGPWTHTIKKGDTLYHLAKRYYGSHTKWKRIQSANKGMEHTPPSANLLTWSKKHRRKRLRIPVRPDAGEAVYAPPV